MPIFWRRQPRKIGVAQCVADVEQAAQAVHADRENASRAGNQEHERDLGQHDELDAYPRQSPQQPATECFEADYERQQPGRNDQPTRVQHQNKDPRGWREFADQLAEHSTEGAALTMRGVQKRRPSLFDLVDKMKAMTVPTLVMTGDEDWPCLEPGILMKKNIPTAALVVMANSGHNINLEEPALFNMHLADLFQAADAGAWPKRDPRAMAGSILGR